LENFAQAYRVKKNSLVYAGHAGLVMAQIGPNAQTTTKKQLLAGIFRTLSPFSQCGGIVKKTK
jgi:hypothetical protein